MSFASPLRIGLVQMRCEKGATAANIVATARLAAEAVERGADVVAFPEMNLTGYVTPAPAAAAIRRDGPELAQLATLTRTLDAAVVVGFIEENPAGKPFITQAVLRRGEPVGFYRKRNVAPDEVEFFAPGSKPFVFKHGGVRIGLAVCADIDRREVFADCAGAGADLVIECAAPGLYGEQATRDWRSGWEWWRGECHEKLGRYAKELGIYIGVSTQAGRTVDEDFPGGGYLFAPDGACIAETGDWREGVLMVTLPGAPRA